MEEKDYFSKICLCRLILVQTVAIRVALFLVQGRETPQRKIYALLLDQERAKTLPAAVHSQLPSA